MTPLKVFSIVQNYKKYFEKNKMVVFRKDVYNGWYDKQPFFIKRKCEQMCECINNNFFTLDDFENFCIFSYIQNDKLNWNYIKFDVIIESIKFVNKAEEEDRKFIQKVIDKTGIKSINDFFIVNSNKQSFMYEFIINRYISPIFYLKMLKYCTVENVSCNFEETDEHRRFRRIFEKIREIKETKETP